MPDEPYRQSEGSSGAAKLARLAQEGERRIHAVSEGRSQVARSEANKHLLLAIGAVRGSRGRVLIPLIVLGALTAIIGFVVTIRASQTMIFDHGANFAFGVPLLFGGILAAVGAYLIYVFLPPTASPAQVDAEHDWIAKLPFALEGYFEALSAKPEISVQLRIELAWQTVGVELPTLQGILGLLDTEARVTGASDRATITTGMIDGSTGVAVNRAPICGNHRVAKYVHKLVDVVLMPVHDNRALASVRVTRA
jgi:hypothetical protein